jgi:hypothetical protein
MRSPIGMLLMSIAGEMAHFLFHYQAHQSQSRFSQQVPYALLQQADNVGHRQDHLDIRVFAGGKLAKFVHRSLFFDLIPSLHSDSLLFLPENFLKAITPPG